MVIERSKIYCEMRFLSKLMSILLLWQAFAFNGRAITVTRISAGEDQSFFIKSDGSLWGMGLNQDGQLGDGTSNSITNFPEQIVATNVTAVSGGGAHCLFLKSDGSVWGTGNNYEGELGNGTYNFFTNRPGQIIAGQVVAIAAGNSHSLFLKTDGSVWATGENRDGQLGDGSFNGTNQLQEVVSNGVVSIITSASAIHSLLIRADGSLWAMGNNYYGQLGDGSFNDTNRPEQIVSAGVIAAATGVGHTLFVKSDGSLWAMGDNEYGQLGAGGINKTNQPMEIVSNGVVAVAAGDNHSLFLKSDGSLWAMGYNAHGQLGIVTYSHIPEQVVASGVVTIAAGGDNSLFIKADGSLWGMGMRVEGQLGDGFSGDFVTENVSVPEQIFPRPQPVLEVAATPEGALQFSATCQFAGTFTLLESPSLTQPLNQWTPIWTNAVTAGSNNNFNATITNAVNSGVAQQLYILRSQ